jgi:protocatechuate 3,4-dioxygenase beta subunit
LRGDGIVQWLAASHSDFAGRAQLQPPSSGAVVVELDITIRRSGTPIRVRVVDAESGSPIARAAVTWLNSVPTTPTGSDGVAIRWGRPNDPRPLSVNAPGYVPHKSEGPPSGTEVEVRLRRSRALEGRVLDTTGMPVSAYVDVFAGDVGALPDEERAKRGIYGEGWLARAVSDANGSFRLTDLPPGPLFVRAWVVRSDARGHRWPRAERLVAQGEAADLRLPAEELTTPGEQQLGGAVFTRDGRRLTRYAIALESDGRSASAVQTGWEFRFAGVLPGSYSLTASTENGKQKGRLPVLVRAGEDVEGLRVVLDETLTLTGRLVAPADVGQVDLEGIHVGLIREGRTGETQAPRLTDASGEFRIQDLEPGRYVVSLRAPAGDRPAWQARDGRIELSRDTALDIAVIAAGRLVLVFDDERFDANPQWERIQDRAVRAALHTEVRIQNGPSAEVKAYGLLRGRRAREWALLAGNYDLEIDTPEFGSFRTSFRAVPGKDTEVRVVLTK